MEIVKAQNAGLQIVPIWPLVSWKVALIAVSTSPRIANTIAVVTSDMQLATNSLCLGMRAPWQVGGGLTI
jgi:hypothetical protein